MESDRSIFTRTPSILVVAGGYATGDQLRRRLVELRYRVSGLAFDAAEAVERACQGHPDVVLVDLVEQEDWNGMGLAEALRRRVDVPIVFVSADSRRVSALQSRGYASALLDSGDLARAIETALLRHGADTARRLYERAMDASQLGMLIVDALDPAHPIIRANPAFETITGYTAAEVLGKNPAFVLEGPGTDPAASRKIRESVAAGEDCRVTVLNYRKDGTPFWNELALSPVVDETGRITHFVGTLNDITERKQADAEVVKAKDAAELANRAKSTFVSAMSHELRTPLNAILGFAQLLLSDRSEPLLPFQREAVTQISRAGDHLLELINEVLDLARIESGNLELSLQPSPLHEVIVECIRLTQPLAGQRGIRLVGPAEDELNAVVLADRKRLKQTLLNLLSNAVKYNREGGSVNVSVREAGPDRVRLAVADTGEGMDARQLAELFQPFNRLGMDGRTEGTGIGLVISKRLVEMMHGELGADSQPGVGSTFWVELERADAPRNAAPAKDGMSAPARDGEDTYPVSVLYIEDNPVNVSLIQQVLRRRPHIELISAGNGRAGIDLARELRPDVILLDINLPGMDGYQVKAELATHGATRNIPVLALSADAMPEQVAKGRAAGFLRYLTKPIDVDEFLSAIDETLRGLH